MTHFLEGFALVINLYHAGLNMMPNLGWQQMLEAWAYSTNKRR